MNPYRQGLQEITVTNPYQFKAGMGDISLVWPMIFLVVVVGVSAGLYYWKQYKESQYEYEEVDAEPSESEDIVNEIADEEAEKLKNSVRVVQPRYQR